MPKVKTQVGVIPVKQPQPYPPQRLRCRENANNATNNSKEVNPKSPEKCDPSSTKNVLKCYLQHYKSTIEATKKASSKMAEKMQKMKMAVAERNEESVKMKRKVEEMKQLNDELQAKNAKLCEDYQNLKHSYDQLNAKYTSFETVYDERFGKLHMDMNKLKSDLAASEKSNEELLCQVNKSDRKQNNKDLLKDEENMQMVVQLKAELGKKRAQLDEMQMKQAQLEKQNNQLQMDFNKKQIELEEKHEQIQQQQEIQLLLLEGELQKLKETYAAKINESTQSEETMKEKLADLQFKLQQNEELSVQAEATHIKIRLQIEQEKDEIVKKLNEQITQKQVEIAALAVQLQEQAFNFAGQNEENNRRVAELQSALGRLKENEALYFDLQQVNSKLSKELMKFEELKSEIKVKDCKIDKLLEDIQNISQAYATKVRNYEVDIEALKLGNEELKTAHTKQIEKAQQELINYERLVEEHDEKLNILKQHYLELTNQLEAEKINMEKELFELRELHERNMTELQNKLKQKEAELDAHKKDSIVMENNKNLIIAGLKYKISHVRNVFGQPISTATILNQEQNKVKMATNGTLELMDDDVSATQSQPGEADADIDNTSDETITKIAAAIAATAPAATTESSSSSKVTAKPTKRRRNVKRSTFILNDSEFNSDSDVNERDELWKPQQKKSVAKKKFTGKNDQTNDIFDYVKQL